MVTIALAKAVEHWQIDKLIPYSTNPRTHSAAQVAQITASIAEFGFTNPILVDSKPGSSLATDDFWARKLNLSTVRSSYSIIGVKRRRAPTSSRQQTGR